MAALAEVVADPGGLLGPAVRHAGRPAALVLAASRSLWVAAVTGPVWNGQGRDPWLPARLEARLQAAQTERSIRAAVWAALSDWLIQLTRRVLRGDERPDLDAIWAMAPLWRDAVDLILRGEILKAVGVAFAKILGPDYRYAARPFVTAYLAEVRNRLVRIPEEVYDLVAGEVAKGVNLGESIPKLAARVDDVLSTTASQRWPNRATVVARSEVVSALNAGRFEAFRIVAADSDDPMETVWLCVLPDTPIVANGVRSVARRRYDGKVWDLRTSSGRRVSLTPQHPVLTGRGWVSAQDLQLGDQLLTVRGVDPVGAPGVEAGHATIEQCFDAAAETREVRTLTREMPGGVDLDSDPTHEQVDVVTAYGHLTQGVEPGLAKDLARLSLEFSDQALARFVVECAVPHRCIGDHPTDPSARSAASAFGGPVSGRPNDPGRTLVPDLDASDTEHPADSVRASAVLGSEGVDGESSLVVLDDLVGIEVSTWGGHVYDFTTHCQWFLADGIVVHNSTDDTRTRPTHRAADGQRVPVGSPFNVGGFELLFPGDPSGPPQEVIQCVIGSTQVGWPGQGVLGSTRRSHSGTFVQLVTAKGHDLTVTPNHPVLTPSGYVPAGLLSPGQHVLSTPEPPSPEVYDAPPSAEKAHRSLCQVGESERVMGGRMDFHGDGADAEVEVVSANRDLGNTANAQGGGEYLHLGLIRPTDREVPLSGMSGAVVLWEPVPGTAGVSLAGRLVSRRGQSPALSGGHARHPDAVGFAGISEWDAQLSQARDDGRTADADFPAHLQYALAAGMTPTEIVQVNRYTGHEWVYNLSTSDHWFTGNGIALHNCRCVPLLVDRGESIDLSNRQMKR